MDKKISLFKPKKDLDASAQVKRFISYARNELTVWGKDLDWDAIVWDITEFIPKAGRNVRHLLQWYQMTDKRGDTRRNRVPIEQPFGDFARAYVRNHQDIYQVKVFTMLLTCLRILERVLKERSQNGEVRVENVDRETLVRCAEIIRNRTSNKKDRYNHGNTMAKLNHFLVENSMVNHPCDWSNPFPCPEEDHRVVTDNDVVANRNAKLPSEAAHKAFLAINAKNETGELSPKDQVVTSLGMIYCAAPERGAEVSDILRDCMVEGTAIGNPTKLFLRWFPVKGGKPQLKPVPDAWTEVGKRAIDRLKRLSEPALQMVFWYEKHPDRIFLPHGHEHLRNCEWLTADQVCDLLGLNKEGLVSFLERKNEQGVEINRKKDPSHQKRGRPPYLYSFVDIERYVLSQLPTNFPYVNGNNGLKYRDCLNIFPLNLLANTRPAASLEDCSKVMFKKFDAKSFYDAITDKAGNRYCNIFARHGYFDEDGNPLGANPHAFRHLLVTMAQEAGMSDLEIAEFRGSRVVEQNEAYKHLTTEEDMIARGMDPEKGMLGREEDKRQIKLITEDEIELMYKRGLQLHENEFGLCAHPIIDEPCPRFLECLGCTEQICRVGDEEKTKNIQRTVQSAELCLANAKQDKQDELLGTDRWIETQQRTVQDGEALLAVLCDPEIPKGTLVKRTGPNHYEPFLEAATARAELTGNKDDRMVLGLIAPRVLPEKVTDV